MNETKLKEIEAHAASIKGKMAEDDIPALVAEVRRLRELVPSIIPGGMIAFGPNCAVDLAVMVDGRGPIWRNRFDEYVERLRS